MKKTAFEKHLRKEGCQLVREGKKHEVWVGPTGKTSSVPRHRELKNPTVCAICRQLEIRLPDGL
ncbi:MAG: type II toxin-antitoxin system HicA family toxin [Fimbriiglobus sp.]